MSTVANDDSTRCLEKPNLLSLLSNHLVLQNTSPFLSARDRLALGATSKNFHHLIHQTPGVFRHLVLSHVKAAQFDIDPIDNGGEVWRNVQVDENVTEDDFYTGPLRGVFGALRRRDLLKDVQTLVLDGLCVTADFINDILVDPQYNIRILSVRGAKHLNHRNLRGALKYACRPSRKAGMPKLKGLYIFSSNETIRQGRDDGASHDQCHDAWWGQKGKMIMKPVNPLWAETMVDCQGAIAFDAVLCSGPRHLNSPAFGTVSNPSTATSAAQWAVATFALPECAGCKSCPEGPTVFGPDVDAARLPLLSPLPELTSSVKAATRPSGGGCPSFVPRCAPCLEGRHCQTCNKWWCEKCYVIPTSTASQPGTTGSAADLEQSAKADHKVPITKSCFECGFNCADCISRTQRRCSTCNAEYCIVHHEGSSSTTCDWCSSHKRTPASTTHAKMRHPPQQRPTGETKDAWMAWMKRQHSAPERAMKSSRQRLVIQPVRCCSPRR